MPDLVIKDAELKQLDEIIKPIPTQWGFGLVAFFQNVAAIRNKEAADRKAAEEKLKEEQLNSLDEGDEDKG